MMMGFFHPGTSRGMLEMTIGSRKITPPRMFLIVPFGERYMRFSPNSSTRASSGVIVAHFTPTPYCLIALAASTVIWSSVASRDSMPRSKYFSSTSRYGRISWSLMNDQMIRVISSPSSSTTGFFTLIFAMRRSLVLGARQAIGRTKIASGALRASGDPSAVGGTLPQGVNRGSLLGMPYRATDRAEARRAAARGRLLDAAHELVASGGFGAASVAAV